MSSRDPKSWRVILFTDTAGFVVHAIDGVLKQAGHRLVAVVTSPGPKQRRSNAYQEIVAATRPGVDVLVSNHPERWAAMLAPLRPDLIMTMGFLWKLPDDLIALPRLGTYNTHGGLLPRGRGPNPIGWAIRNDEGEIGWTVHQMTSELDMGPVLTQNSMPIGDDDDAENSFETFVGLLVPLWMESIELITQGAPLEPQDESQAYYAGMFEDEWREIDWNRPAREVHNQVRSWHGQRGVEYGAFGDIDGQRMLITKTRLYDGESNCATPGTVISRDGELLVQCGDRPLRVLAYEPVAAET
jgi:methionyl-tRNA formyltransferase